MAERSKAKSPGTDILVDQPVDTNVNNHRSLRLLYSGVYKPITSIRRVAIRVPLTKKVNTVLDMLGIFLRKVTEPRWKKTNLLLRQYPVFLAFPNPDRLQVSCIRSRKLMRARMYTRQAIQRMLSWKELRV
jgi:hypothetical protein